jgi:hypothetical protein
MPPKKKSAPINTTAKQQVATESTNTLTQGTQNINAKGNHQNTVLEPISNSAALAQTNNIPASQEQQRTINGNDTDDDKKNKRRGRKPKDKFNIDDAYTEQNNSLLDFDNNIIIKLPIACKDLESELSLTTGSVLYNPILSEPQPFNECSDMGYGIIETQDEGSNKTDNKEHNNGHNISMITNQQIEPAKMNYGFNSAGKQQQQQSQQQIQPNYMDYYQNKINDLLSDLDDTASKKRLTQIEILLNKKYNTAKQIDLLHNLAISYDGTKWPQTSNICCFWCCHNFDNKPWGIPKKYNAETGIFTMYGIFCSPNCVLAYLLRNEPNNISLWEQVSLLNLLHYKIYETDENIVPAPDNVCLRMFGGPLNIQEFRALTLKNEKKYNVNFPPCVIITPVLEETKKVFNQDSYYIPIDKKRINKIQTELKIKRTNNVYKNSLENVMNISYNQ